MTEHRTKSTVKEQTWPAYSIVRPYEGRRFAHGQKIGIPYTSTRGDTLVRFYTLGTVLGYAVTNGDEPLANLERAKAAGHETHWANANSFCLTAHKQPHETVPGFNHGDIIVLEGLAFRIDPDHNSNIKLTPID